MTKNTIAIIPARIGSKRLPHKNTASFKGKTLPAHTIEQALEAGIFEKIIVTSDDPKVIDIASNYNVIINNRDSSLSTDKTPLTEVIKNIITTYNLHEDSIIALLLVTCPLRTVEDIRRAYDNFLFSDKTNAVVSVTHIEYPVEMSWTLQEGRLYPFRSEGQLKTTQKQNFEQRYKYNDAIIFDLAKHFMVSNRNLFGKTPLPYLMPPERSVAIDYEFDLKLAQIISEYYE